MDVLFAYNQRGFLHAVTCDEPPTSGVAFMATMRAQGCRVQRLTMPEYRALRGLDRTAVAAAPARRTLPYSGSRALHIAVIRQMVLAPRRAAQKKALAILPPWTEPENLCGDPSYFPHAFRWYFSSQDSAARLAARRQHAAHLLFGRPLGNWGQRQADLHQDAQAERGRFAVRLSPALPAVGLDVLAPHIGRGTVITHITLPDGVRVALVRGRSGEALARPGEWEAAPSLPVEVAASPPPIPAPMPPPAPSPLPLPSRPATTTMPSLFGDWS